MRTRFRSPALPTPRGPVSSAVIDALRSGDACDVDVSVVADCDPWGGDLQLALLVCQELAYRGWDGVPDRREWEQDVVAVRIQLEDRFLAAVRAECAGSESSAAAELHALLAPMSDEGTASRLNERGTEREFSDYFAARSLYHLKEADPHAWVIPRLPPAIKAPFVAVEFDEYGGGRSEAVHQVLYADLLDDYGLSSEYLAYLDASPAEALATVTLMTALGQRREYRGACIGHFAATEITSSPACARILGGLERLNAPERVAHFYREHVEADAVHEAVMRDEVVAGLLAEEPEQEANIVFGIRAFNLVEDRLGAAFVRAWDNGTTVLQPEAA